MVEVGIAIMVLALVLAGVVTVATVRKSRGEGRGDRVRCACYEYVGDNPNCPVTKHRSMAREYERKWRQTGAIPGRK